MGSSDILLFSRLLNFTISNFIDVIIATMASPARVGSSQDQNATLKLGELSNQLSNPVFSV